MGWVVLLLIFVYPVFWIYSIAMRIEKQQKAGSSPPLSPTQEKIKKVLPLLFVFMLLAEVYWRSAWFSEWFVIGFVILALVESLAFGRKRETVILLTIAILEGVYLWSGYEPLQYGILTILVLDLFMLSKKSNTMPL